MLDYTRLYNIDTNTWTAGAPAPLPVRSEESYGDTTPWSTVPAEMPTAPASLVAGKVGNRIYAIGGCAGGPRLGVNEVYSVAKDSWSTDTPMTTPRGEAGVYSHGGRIYIVGGA